MRKLDPAAALFLIVMVGGCLGRGEGTRDAPDFTLPALVGEDSVSLEDFEGRYVLMNFWASWCGPCREEVPALLAVHRRLTEAGLTVLGVTVNDLPEDSRGFAHEYGIDYPNVIGNDRLYEDYGLSPWIPVSLLIDGEGRIVHKWEGPQTEESFLEAIRSAAPELASAVAARTPK